METLDYIANQLKNNVNLFITGGAGSGKSYILRKLKYLLAKDITLTATTGVAALNIGGSTIHSFAKLGIGSENAPKIAQRIRKDPKSLAKIEKLQILAIDEISMLSAKFLNTLNEVLQIVKESSAPFGGVTVIFFGDFLQLPPVIKKEEEDSTCLNCYAWREAEIETIVLNCNHRQKEDLEFFNLLQSIRMGHNLDKAYEALQSRVNASPKANTIKLVSHREQAYKINLAKLECLQFEEKVFIGKFSGSAEHISSFAPYFQDLVELKLKRGARVMLNFNVNVEAGLCNGSIGNVIDFSTGGLPVVLFDSMKTPVIVSVNDFIIEDPTTSEALFKFTQIPLQLAYAITIHKSQGLTFENIETDIGKCFANGQAYVSLSRVKTLDGLFLHPFSKSVLKADAEIVKYYESLKNVG